MEENNTIIVYLGPRPSMPELLDDGTGSDAEVKAETVEVVRKNPRNSYNRLISTLNSYGRRLRELERPSGYQLSGGSALMLSQDTSDRISDLETRIQKLEESKETGQ